MKLIPTKCGHIAYQTSAEEIISIGGMGICDHCNEKPPVGILIPVLNHWICEECFKDWDKRAKFYPEDCPAERRIAAYYRSVLRLENAQT